MWQERLNEFGPLFLVVNPIAVVPVFLAPTGALGRAAKRQVALIAVAVSFGVLVFFIFAGSFLIKRLGISITASGFPAGSCCSYSRARWFVAIASFPRPAPARSPRSRFIRSPSRRFPAPARC
jgi:hypothetical protein